MKTSLFVFLSFFTSFSVAYQQSTYQSAGCPDRFEKRLNTQVQQLATRDGSDCFISLGRTDNWETLHYRSYLVSDSGSLLVFLSLGEGPEDKMTGSKEFYFFPRHVKTQNFAWSDNDQSLIVNSSFDFTFDANTSEIAAISNAVVQLDPEFSPENDAGVSMTPLKNLIYELPFVLNGAPSTDMNQFGIFKDAFNHQCRVKVNKIFKPISNGDSAVKYTDAQLKTYLKTLCPEIKY